MDNGYIALISDLKELYDEAAKYEFDDFKNDKYAAPKLALLGKLNNLISNVKNGKYDQTGG